MPTIFLDAGRWIWENILDSQFISSLFGAGFGAYAAYRISLKSEAQKRIAGEIGLVNAGMGMALNILNAFIELRGQQIVSIAETYEKAFQEFVAITESPAARAGQPVVYTQMFDLRMLRMPTVPIRELSSVLESPEMTLTTARVLLGTLSRAIEQFDFMLKVRNEAAIQQRGLQLPDRVSAYFGLKLSTGNIDSSLPDAILAIDQGSEDALYFSELIIEKLNAHGEALVSKYGKGAPSLMKIDFSHARSEGRLARREKYSGFESQFRPISGDLRFKVGN